MAVFLFVFFCLFPLEIKHWWEGVWGVGALMFHNSGEVQIRTRDERSVWVNGVMREMWKTSMTYLLWDDRHPNKDGRVSTSGHSRMKAGVRQSSTNTSCTFLMRNLSLQVLWAIFLVLKHYQCLNVQRQSKQFRVDPKEYKECKHTESLLHCPVWAAQHLSAQRETTCLSKQWCIKQIIGALMVMQLLLILSEFKVTA